MRERFQLVGTGQREMNQHVIEHGRMFNEIDDETPGTFASSAQRDQLFGTPKKSAMKSFLGSISISTISLSDHWHVRRYESEQDRKLRELEKNQLKQIQTGSERRRGWAGVAGRIIGSME